MSEEPIEEVKVEPDLSKLKTDKDDKYIVTEDLDPTPIKYAVADETYAVQPERFDTEAEAKNHIKTKKLKGYSVVETR
jgi:hypothetical protein